MYKVEDFVIIIYCLIEDELYPAFCRHHGLPRRAGFLPALSDSECLAIELVGPYLGYASQKQLYEQMHDRWSTWFPALKDRVAFTRQCTNLWQVKAWMHHHLVDRLGGYQAPCQIIDTLPLPICHAARRFQRRIFRTESVGPCPPPTQGYCAAKDEVFFGFKGGLRITDYGLIVHAPLLPAYGHDSTCCEPLLAGIQAPTQGIGDAAFLALDRQQELKQHHLHLLPPSNAICSPPKRESPLSPPLGRKGSDDASKPSMPNWSNASTSKPSKSAMRGICRAYGPPKYSPIRSAYGSIYASNENRWTWTDSSNGKSHTSRIWLKKIRQSALPCPGY